MRIPPSYTTTPRFGRIFTFPPRDTQTEQMMTQAPGHIVKSVLTHAMLAQEMVLGDFNPNIAPAFLKLNETWFGFTSDDSKFVAETLNAKENSMQVLNQDSEPLKKIIAHIHKNIESIFHIPIQIYSAGDSTPPPSAHTLH